MRASLIVPPHVYSSLVMVARDCLPDESCGILAGHHHGRVERIFPVDNIAEQPANQFRIDSRALNQHLPQIRADGLQVIGFFHSHPATPPVPSPHDITGMHDMHALHLIVSLKGSAPRLAAWRIEGARISAVDLILDDCPAPPEAESFWNEAATPAIMVGVALIAIISLIVLSFNLLPPAP
ncbi:MAG: M67 family peptidase [Anaerolineaceae bacterium]|nr:MAG: M67 family peptidase [Anaerolineaceae bacterium]